MRSSCPTPVGRAGASALAPGAPSLARRASARDPGWERRSRIPTADEREGERQRNEHDEFAPGPAVRGGSCPLSPWSPLSRSSNGSSRFGREHRDASLASLAGDPPSEVALGRAPSRARTVSGAHRLGRSSRLDVSPSWLHCGGMLSPNVLQAESEGAILVRAPEMGRSRPAALSDRAGSTVS